MTEQERFELENEDGEICIIDNIRKKYLFVFVCEDIDMQEGMLNECLNVVNCLNQTWEMTLRFEKYNQEYIEDNEQLKQENEQLKEENNLLKIALCYALDDMGSSYHIDLFERIFNFRFYELMGGVYDIDWEDLLKGDGEND